ncbi:T9SS type A sorting domain-containing protein, partial [bacterium]
MNTNVLGLGLILPLFFIFTSEISSAQTKPSFSHNPGYYSASFNLEIIAGESDEIFYTLNGDTPDSTSFKYTTAVLIDDRSSDSPSYSSIQSVTTSYYPWVAASGPIQLATVVRARSKNGTAWSETTTGTFIVHQDGSNRYQIPVVSLVTDSLNLFDYNTGIYTLGKIYDDWKAANPGASEGLSTPANYTQKGDEWERPAHFEYFNEHGEEDLSMNIGIRIHGGGSRAFQQKTFRLYARKEYGESKFEYPFFVDQELAEYKRLQLRNSGQDWMKTALRDGFAHSLVRHLPFETMAFRQAVLFLNGEFWGIANIRERYDDKYLSIKFDIPDDEIDYLSGDASIEEGSADHYNAMMNYIAQNGVSGNAHFEYIQTQMDTESFKYYYLSNIFFNNRDWPHNNIEYWRFQTEYSPEDGAGKDGRWRWMLFDTDFGFAWTDIHTEEKYQGHVKQDYLAHATRADHWSTFLIRELLKNDEFKNDFINSYRDLANTAFKKERVVSILDSLETLITPYALEHLERWGNSNHRWSMPHDIEEWHTNVNYIRRFANERESYMNQFFRTKFGLDTLYMIQVGVNDSTMGFVRVNKLDITHSNPGIGDYQAPNMWSGNYFKGQPITITAVAKDGFTFSHWEHAQSDSSSFVQSDVGLAAIAVFEPDNGLYVESIGETVSKQIQLHQNYPNPFNPSTTIQFELPKADFITISVYSITGQKVKDVYSGTLKSGLHKVNISMQNYASGMYYYELKSSIGTAVKSMLL